MVSFVELDAPADSLSGGTIPADLFGVLFPAGRPFWRSVSSKHTNEIVNFARELVSAKVPNSMLLAALWYEGP